MKKLFYILVLLPLIFTACEVSPDAYFYVDEVEVYVGEEVFFTNDSYNAVDFHWDFGDGTYSTAYNAVHTYNASGEYDVVLTATSRTGVVDEAYATITVLSHTILEIKVRDIDYPDDGVANARVRLYPTLTDWDYETNLVIEAYTNSNGNVVFNDLGPFVYYVDIFEEYFDNWGLGALDAAYIRTPQVVENEITSFTAYVEYVDPGLKSAGRSRAAVIANTVRKGK